MKATIEFLLPEDRYELDAALASSIVIEALRQVDYKLRAQLKHGSVETHYECMEECRSIISEALFRANLDV